MRPTDLAGVLEEEQKYEEAQTLRSEILAVRKRAEPDSPSTVNATFELGRLQADRGNLDAAEPLLRAAYEADRRLLKPEDVATLQSMDQLAFVLLDKGQAREAKALYRDELAILRKNRPPADKDLRPATLRLGPRPLASKQSQGGGAPVARSLAYSQSDAPGGPLEGRFHRKPPGGVSVGPRPIQFRRAVAGRCLPETQGGPRTPTAPGRTAHDRVVKLYEAWKKPDAAARWKAEPLGK